MSKSDMVVRCRTYRDTQHRHERFSAVVFHPGCLQLQGLGGKMQPEEVEHQQLERLMRCVKDSMRLEASSLCIDGHAFLLWQGTLRVFST